MPWPGDIESSETRTSREKVPGGWIVTSTTGNQVYVKRENGIEHYRFEPTIVSPIFVSDPRHKWIDKDE